MKTLLFFYLTVLAVFQAIPSFGQEPEDRKYYPEYSNDPCYKGFHLGLYGGAWIPGGQLAKVGRHPYAGVQIGYGSRKLILSLSIAARFLKARHPFTIQKDDSLYNSRHYSGGYFGLDGSYSLFKKGRHQWDAEAGIAVETMQGLSIKPPDDNDKITKTLVSPNFNIGTGYKFWLKDIYIGLDLKYNFLFFNNKNATDFKGNVITVGLVFGGIAVQHKTANE